MTNQQLLDVLSISEPLNTRSENSVRGKAARSYAEARNHIPYSSDTAEVQAVASLEMLLAMLVVEKGDKSVLDEIFSRFEQDITLSALRLMLWDIRFRYQVFGDKQISELALDAIGDLEEGKLKGIWDI